jgi:hypothetical protein
MCLQNCFCAEVLHVPRTGFLLSADDVCCVRRRYIFCVHKMSGGEGGWWWWGGECGYSVNSDLDAYCDTLSASFKREARENSYVSRFHILHPQTSSESTHRESILEVHVEYKSATNSTFNRTVLFPKRHGFRCNGKTITGT